MKYIDRRPNILFLVHRVPYPLNRGDRIRSYNILKYLATRGNVSLATLADETVEPSIIKALQPYCAQLAIEPLTVGRWVHGAISLASGRSATEGLFRSSALWRTIRKWCRHTRFDLVVAFCSSMVQYLNMKELRDVPKIVDLVDVDSQKFYDYARHSGFAKGVLYSLEGRRLRQLEKSLPDRVSAITLVSRPEAELFRAVVPNEKTFVVPNGVDLEFFCPHEAGDQPWSPLPETDRTNLVFVGALNYHANVDGVTWFAHKVWPLIRSELPHLTLGLVGRNPVRAVRRLAAIPGIRVFASVPDVRPHVAGADIAIAPLRVARGVQNKLLEAMAMAKPVICSTAAHGLSAKDGRDVIVADTPADWQQAIQEVYANPQAAARIAQSGFHHVRRHYTWSALVEHWPSTLNAADHVCNESALSTNSVNGGRCSHVVSVHSAT